jgi:hypothetical protein
VLVTLLDTLLQASANHPMLARVIAGEVEGQAFLVDAGSLPVVRTFGAHLARGLACLGTGKRPCGTCAVCREPRPPHLAHIEPLGVEFRIQQIHEILQECNLAMEPGARRVYFLDGIEAMNEESANAFLKVLEEPPPAVVFVLSTAARQQVLPTIRSRCHSIHVDFPSTVSLLEGALASSPIPKPWLYAILEIWGRSPALLQQAAQAEGMSRGVSAATPAAAAQELLKAHAARQDTDALADPEAGLFCDLRHALDSSAFFLGSLSRVLGKGTALAALDETAALTGWIDGVREAVTTGLRALEAQRRKVHGTSYVHPLFEDEMFERSFYRRVSFLAADAFLRSALLLARAALSAGEGTEGQLLEGLSAECPAVETALGRGAGWAREVENLVSLTRSRYQANVTLRYTLDAFLLSLALPGAGAPRFR